jgi:hypothetical protein
MHFHRQVRQNRRRLRANACWTQKARIGGPAHTPMGVKLDPSLPPSLIPQKQNLPPHH